MINIVNKELEFSDEQKKKIEYNRRILDCGTLHCYERNIA